MIFTAAPIGDTPEISRPPIRDTHEFAAPARAGSEYPPMPSRGHPRVRRQSGTPPNAGPVRQASPFLIGDTPKFGTPTNRLPTPEER